jgi:hypothetical protein
MSKEIGSVKDTVLNIGATIDSLQRHQKNLENTSRERDELMGVHANNRHFNAIVVTFSYKDEGKIAPTHTTVDIGPNPKEHDLLVELCIRLLTKRTEDLITKIRELSQSIA